MPILSCLREPAHPRALLPVLLTLCLGLSFGRACAQSRPMPLQEEPVEQRNKRIWAVHVQFSFPEEMIGGAVHYVPPEGWGGYGSIWLSTNRVDDERYYYEEIDRDLALALGGSRIEEKSQWSGGRAGLTRRVDRGFYLYGGVGAMRSNNYEKYEGVPPPTGSPESQIWIDAERPNDTRFVLEVGAVYYTEGGIAFSLGIGTFPAGVSFGLGFGNKL